MSEEEETQTQDPVEEHSNEQDDDDDDDDDELLVMTQLPPPQAEESTLSPLLLNTETEAPPLLDLHFEDSFLTALDIPQKKLTLHQLTTDTPQSNTTPDILSENPLDPSNVEETTVDASPLAQPIPDLLQLDNAPIDFECSFLTPLNPFNPFVPMDEAPDEDEMAEMAETMFEENPDADEMAETAEMMLEKSPIRQKETIDRLIITRDLDLEDETIRQSKRARYDIGDFMSSAILGTTNVTEKISTRTCTNVTEKIATRTTTNIAEKINAPRINISTSKHRDFTKIPEKGVFIRATSTTKGTPIYFPKASSALAKSDKPKLQGWKTGAGRLLETSIYKIMDEIDSERLLRVQDSTDILNDTDIVDEVRDDTGKQLWVDKYGPKRFTDLIGDERINRQVLRWLKQWDFCVFGSESAQATAARKSRQMKAEASYTNGEPIPQYQDPYLRPERKVLLLAGPPGLGKTTLAHVVAATAGYNVIEVNASDDRTGAVVRNKIMAATQMQSVLGDKKPNLVVIDEIDGVAAGGEQSFIKLLVDMIMVEPQNAPVKSNTTTGRKKKNRQQPLLRPIICICNDQYAAVLKPLRQIAQIFTFPAPQPSELAKRLAVVCTAENIQTDMRTLGALCTRTGSDTRSCLNTLQFVKGNEGKHGKKVTVLTMDSLDKASCMMMKDSKGSAKAIWEALFESFDSKKKKRGAGLAFNHEDGDRSKGYLSNLVSRVVSFEDVDKLMKGCFENYPTMKFNDDLYCSKLVAIGEWMDFYDKLSSRVYGQHQYDFAQYLPYTVAVYHRLFAGSIRQQVEYPKADYENHMEKKANENVMSSLLSSLSPLTRRSFGIQGVAAVELVSPLLRIISPNMKQVNVQLIKPSERNMLSRMVKLMITFNIGFVQERNEDGLFVYRLEPPIDRLVKFSTAQPTDVLSSRYAVRQLISQEIERELLRRSDESTEKRLGISAKELSLTRSMVSSKKDSLEEKQPTDFFGRPVILIGDENHDGEGSKKGEGGKMSRKKIFYKYNEGYSNAVRKVVYVGDL